MRPFKSLVSLTNFLLLGKILSTHLKHQKEELTLVELGSHMCIEESFRVQDNDKLKGNNFVSPLVVNMMEHNNSFRYNDNKGKHKHHDTKANPNKKPKVTCWKCRKPGHLKKDCKGGKVSNKANSSGTNGSVHGSTNSLKDDDVVWAIVRLPDPKLKTLGEIEIECIFIRYAEHSKAFRFYVIEPNESVLINLIIESRDDIFYENRFYSFPRPSLRIPNGTEDIGGSVVPEEVVEEVVEQPGLELRKSNKNMTTKNFRHEFQLYLIKGTRDKVSNQHSYCFNVEDEPKTFDEAIKSQDVALWKEAINDEMDSIMGNNTWVLADLPPGCKPLGCKWIFKRKLKMVVKTTFLNGELEEEVYMNQYQGFIMFSMKDMREADVILGIRIKHESNRIEISQSYYIEKVLKKINYFDCTPVSTPIDTSEKPMPNNGHAISQLKYSRVIGCLMYVITCTRPDIAFAVGKLSRYTSNPGTQHWQAIQRVLKYLKKPIDYSLTYNGYHLVLEGYIDASWISNTEDNSSTSGWVILLFGGAISWASKKQTCITDSTMESEFMALADASEEAEWLRNLILEIPLWSKPIAPISIRCDSAATLANAYS
ncbi:zinc finger, CCHC-type containing protein [Tanacetum coccineum]